MPRRGTDATKSGRALCGSRLRLAVLPGMYLLSLTTPKGTIIPVARILEGIIPEGTILAAILVTIPAVIIPVAIRNQTRKTLQDR